MGRQIAGTLCDAAVIRGPLRERGAHCACIGLKGFADLRAAGTTMHPTGTASALVTDGVYARTRNPLYLAALIAFAGLGLALRSTWLLIAVPCVGAGVAAARR